LYEIALVVRATDVGAMRTFGFMLFALLIQMIPLPFFLKKQAVSTRYRRIRRADRGFDAWPRLARPGDLLGHFLMDPDIKRYQDNLRDELNGAALYAALAAPSPMELGRH
jgi:hypothetical protein